MSWTDGPSARWPVGGWVIATHWIMGRGFEMKRSRECWNRGWIRDWTARWEDSDQSNGATVRQPCHSAVAVLLQLCAQGIRSIPFSWSLLLFCPHFPEKKSMNGSVFEKPSLGWKFPSIDSLINCLSPKSPLKTKELLIFLFKLSLVRYFFHCLRSHC